MHCLFVGLFILLMAIINFVNIAISSSSARIKEIGIRKVLGGLRKQIIVQFLTESVILVLLATLVAIAAYPFIRPLFGELVGKEIPGLSSFPAYFIFIPAALVLLVGIMAGFVSCHHIILAEISGFNKRHIKSGERKSMAA
ncbi:MAG: FtsX-like permease family protein [Bacteroidota bacterium]